MVGKGLWGDIMKYGKQGLDYVDKAGKWATREAPWLNDISGDAAMYASSRLGTMRSFSGKQSAGFMASSAIAGGIVGGGYGWASGQEGGIMAGAVMGGMIGGAHLGLANGMKSPTKAINNAANMYQNAVTGKPLTTAVASAGFGWAGTEVGTTPVNRLRRA